MKEVVQEKPVIQEKPIETPIEEKKPEVILDNTPDSWAADVVRESISAGIIQGDENGNYKLHSNCTRQDVLVFLYRMYKTIK